MSRQVFDEIKDLITESRNPATMDIDAKSTIEILQLINRALSNKSFGFEVAIDYGDSNWIAMLSSNEKQRLKMERGWHFLW